jgi:hypothetical protein
MGAVPSQMSFVLAWFALRATFPPSSMQEQFANACWNGDLQEAQRLFALGGMNIHAIDVCTFPYTCMSGHLVVAKWLFGMGGVGIDALHDAFRLACWRGHLAVAQWLLGLGAVDIHARDDYAFRCACDGGRLAVAQWLFALGGVDIHALNDAAFHWACYKGHLGLGRWLVALDPSWDWPSKDMEALQAWSRPRDAWMRAVLSHSLRLRKWRW